MSSINITYNTNFNINQETKPLVDPRDNEIKLLKQQILELQKLVLELKNQKPKHNLSESDSELKNQKPKHGLSVADSDSDSDSDLDSDSDSDSEVEQQLKGKDLFEELFNQPTEVDI